MTTRIPLSHAGLPADVADRFAWHRRAAVAAAEPDAVAPAGRPARFPLAALTGFALTGVIIVIAVVLFARNPALGPTQPVASGSGRATMATPASMVAARVITPSPTPATAPASLAITAAAATTGPGSPAATARTRMPGAGSTSTATGEAATGEPRGIGARRDDVAAAASACRNSWIAQYLARHGMPLTC
jgi:hypothetical protein